MQNPSDLAEGDSAHLEAQYTPIDDPKLKIEWFRNGQPLFHANRYKMVQDFGFAILDILHLFAQVSKFSILRSILRFDFLSYG